VTAPLERLNRLLADFGLSGRITRNILWLFFERGVLTVFSLTIGIWTARYLTADGVFRMAVPDANHPSAYYRELTRPGGIGEGADDHRQFFSIGDVPALEEATGLEARPLEYFDAQGIFVAVPYEEAAGLVRPSSRRYAGPLSGSGDRARRLLDTTPEPLREQFATLGITYTSLIVDWSKNSP